MSIFASDTRVIIPLPQDPPHTVTLQKLTRAQFLEAIATDTLEARIAFLITHGLVGWSYDKPISQATIADLGVDDATFISDEVLYLARPAMRAALAEATAGTAVEEERKNV
jgi:hypothetical protein